MKYSSVFSSPALIYCAVAYLVFGQLLHGFFLQDEWAIFGNFLYWEKAQLSWFTRLFVYEQDTHLIPLANAFSYLQFKLFNLSFPPYAVTSIFLHVLNAVGVYAIAKHITQKDMVGKLAGLLFLVNAPSQQAVTWIATSPGTVPATLFTLCSILFVMQRKILFSIISFILALGFKETSIFLFLYLPFLLFIPLKRMREAKSLIGLLSAVAIGYSITRTYFFLTRTITAATEADLAQPSILVYVFRVLSLPLKSLVQSIVPEHYLIAASDGLIKLAYPQFVVNGVGDPYLVQSVGVDMITYCIGGITLLCILFFSKIAQSTHIWFKTVAIVSVGLIVASSLPFIVIPGKAGYFSLFDGRHLYIVSVGMSLLLASVLYVVYLKFQKVFLLKALILFTLFLYIGGHCFFIVRHLNSQVEVAAIRKSLLSRIMTSYPTLPQKTIVYTISDKAYYGLPREETILPFQSGFGNTLLVWYDQHGQRFPACFFEKKYLYVLLEENYKECDGRGFGYYRSPEDLNSLLAKYALKSENIRAFSFYSENNELIDSTEDVQKSLYEEDAARFN